MRNMRTNFAVAAKYDYVAHRGCRRRGLFGFVCDIIRMYSAFGYCNRAAPGPNQGAHCRRLVSTARDALSCLSTWKILNEIFTSDDV